MPPTKHAPAPVLLELVFRSFFVSRIWLSETLIHIFVLNNFSSYRCCIIMDYISYKSYKCSLLSHETVTLGATFLHNQKLL